MFECLWCCGDYVLSRYFVFFISLLAFGWCLGWCCAVLAFGCAICYCSVCYLVVAVKLFLHLLSLSVICIFACVV